jgi:type 1 glutamine amidotransferase/glucose/arabinose dehydrogenase/PKD repeat protein
MRKAALLAGLVAALCAVFALPSVAAAAPKFRVLVFSKTAGFRHDSIETGVARVKQLGTANNFAVDATEDATAFRAANLRRYQAVIFLSTTGDVLNKAQQNAFENYIGDGGGYVGIHSAADTEYDWPFYGNLVGAYFKQHPAQQNATIKVADKVHPATKHLPDRWNRFDEWYDYRANPRGDVHVLATLDETSYQNGTMGSDHPITWCQEYGGGRSFYTGLGHTKESYGEPAFQKLLLGAIRWSAGDVAGDCGATVEGRFQKVTLNDFPIEGMGIAPLPQGRVLMTERKGRVMLHDPATGLNTVAAKLDVYQHDEEGVQSIAIDPNFKSNKWVYIYHSLPTGNTPVDDPATPTVNEGDAPFTGTAADFAKFKGIVRLSRYKMQGDKINLGTEQQILDVPVDRGLCCHVGGHIDFDSQGNLYLSTGDDTNPFESDGYAPIDDRPGRNPGFDARRSAGNTNDLRGKVLRIKPKAGGGYEIPAGNLFPAGAPNTKPEIYLMGLRNPFRIAINKDNDDLYVGDYSPDANAPDPERGPDGKGKWFVARGPGNYGWPYCATDQLPYQDYDFGTETSSGAFNCAKPINDSPYNTGLRELPPTKHPDVWYGYGASAEFPELGTGGIGPMAGPAYQYKANSSSRIKWPQYYDNVPLFYEWTRDWVKEMRLDDSGKLLKINPVLPSFTFDNPMDIEFGEDGALYTLEYGTGYFVTLPEAQLARIDYVRGNRTPIVKASGEPTDSPTAPLEVHFSSAGTNDPDGDRLTYQWDFDADGTFDSTERNPTHVFEEEGVYNATLKVTDRTGRSASAEVQIVVGNERPTIEFVKPVAGQPFHFGDTVQVEVKVTDDQEVDCTKVQLSYILGHDSHGHPISSTTGCTGQFVTSAGGHDPATQNLRAVFAASYTDPGTGADGEGALTGNAEIALTPTP